MNDFENEKLKSFTRTVARKICTAFDIAPMRGRHYANDPESTIAIIIAEALKNLAAQPPRSGGRRDEE